MKLHRFIIKPLSPWGTRLRSDTLYGLLLGHIAAREGEIACREAIERFKCGQPPFVVSSVMPAGEVFFPKLPPVPRSLFLSWVETGVFKDEKGVKLNIYEALLKYKKFRKLSYLPEKLWQKHAGQLSLRSLFEWFCDLPAQGEKKFSKEGSEVHVTISRQSNTALEGELFFSSLTYFAQNSRFHLYTHTGDKESFLGLLREVGDLGFGKDASLGKGRFEVEDDPTFDPVDVSRDEARPGLLLSVCAAPDMADMKGWYGLEVKRGKAAPGWGNPFKSPLLLVQEGSILTSLPRGPYVLENIHPRPELVQITHPLTLPCQVDCPGGLR